MTEQLSNNNGQVISLKAVLFPSVSWLEQSKTKSNSEQEGSDCGEVPSGALECWSCSVLDLGDSYIDETYFLIIYKQCLHLHVLFCTYFIVKRRR